MAANEQRRVWRARAAHRKTTSAAVMDLNGAGGAGETIMWRGVALSGSSGKRRNGSNQRRQTSKRSAAIAKTSAAAARDFISNCGSAAKTAAGHRHHLWLKHRQLSGMAATMAAGRYGGRGGALQHAAPSAKYEKISGSIGGKLAPVSAFQDKLISGSNKLNRRGLRNKAALALGIKQHRAALSAKLAGSSSVSA